MGLKVFKNILVLVLILGAFCGQLYAYSDCKPGLVGAWFGNIDFTNCKEAQVLESFDLQWEGKEHGREWSGKWQGYLVGPIDGEVTFYIDTNRVVEIDLEGVKCIKTGAGRNIARVRTEKGRRYPVEIRFFQKTDLGESHLKIEWSWAGKEKSEIGGGAVCHTVEMEKRWDYKPDGHDSSIDMSNFIEVPVKNVLVYREDGHYAGWPANTGIWSWGNEILVGFHTGYYKFRRSGHSIDYEKPQRTLLARSIDGGQTWKVEDPKGFASSGKVTLSAGGVDFTHPDFAMRVTDGKFSYSYDRGRSWNGYYKLGKITATELTSRTDYVVGGRNSCMLFLSAKEQRVESGMQDRAFCARTVDGGRSFEFLSWITDNVEVRSVMPSTVKISEDKLLTALRRRHDVRRDDRPGRVNNWVDVYGSNNNGESWNFVSKVAVTDDGGNGNPPAMVLLGDGRVCVAYGCRARPWGIRARISKNQGQTWSREIILRKDAIEDDIGYPRMVVRPDGNLVTIYYYITKENPQQHIAATIWDPGKVD